MKKIYAAILLLVAVGSEALADSTCLTLNFEKGDIVRFALNEKPTMTFGTSDLTVTTDKNTTASYERDEIKDFTFTQGTTGAIAELTGDSDYTVEFPAPAIVTITGNNIADATVYNAAGSVMATAASSGQSVTVDLSTLPSGVYLIEIPGLRTLKIRK
ncbi:MAG: T9SS type A sorting domain-containing protein [Paramuribaculum sp.]|nr:T9SS type A sorting domain-containing protein [Paramuribaculum sp.]MDE6322977.1 T9SS type A sorting domain-containing protein [Paramuribaculum sp.]